MESIAERTSTIATRDLFRLDNRTVLVTGGLGGVGTALVHTILESGGDVLCLDLPDRVRDEEAFATTCHPNRTHFIYRSVDVTDASSLNSTLKNVLPSLRFPLRGVVTTAGISGECSAIDYPPEAFRRMLDVNIMGSFLPVQAAARIMRQQKSGGSIVLIASISGWITNKTLPTIAYNTSKAAIHQLARSLAAEWARLPDSPPIRVNTISPGYIATPLSVEAHIRQPELKEQNMLARVSAPAEFRGPVLFLLGDGSSFVTGADLKVDGGHCAW